MIATAMVETNPTTVDPSGTPAPAPHPPRRPRVREVSSRFMSPVVSVKSSASSVDLHTLSDRSPMHRNSVMRSISANRRTNQQEAEPLGSADENRLETARTPMRARKPQRAAVKLFKENNEGRAEQVRHQIGEGLRSFGGIEVASKFMAPKNRRPGTPTVSSSFEKNLLHRTGVSSSCPATPAAARQLQLGGVSVPSSTPSQSQSSASAQYYSRSAGDDFDRSCVVNASSTDSIGSDASSVESSSCSTSSILVQKCRTPRLQNEQVRSSMPETSMSMTVSSRYSGDRTGIRGSNEAFLKVSTSPCCRSLNMSVSSMQHGLGSGTNLPPHAPGAKVVGDARTRKVNTQQESVHSLKMLHNRYLQWRFANAKAEASMIAQTKEAERMLYSLSIKIYGLRELVTRKRMELARLRRSKTLFFIIEAQMPGLEDWCGFEESYISSLSDLISGLQNASIRLPISGNVKVDMREFGKELDSACKVMEMIESHISSFMPKAAEMDELISELAQVSSVERGCLEECGDRLSKNHMLQVDESSTIAQLIQLQQRSCS